MKYRKKKYSKKKIHTKQEKKKIKKSKKQKKHNKKFKGGAAEQPPVSPQLISQASGRPIHAINPTTGTLEPVMEKNIQKVWDYLQENPHCKTPTNCGPLSSYVLSSNFNPVFFELWIKSRDEWETKYQAYKDDKGPEPPSIDFLQEFTQQKELIYVRNINSRPPIKEFSLFETENKMWTEEPLKDFIRDIIRSGIHEKNLINDMQASGNTESPILINEGCIQIVLYNLDITGKQEEYSHAINICRVEGNEIIIVDLQNSEKPIMQGPDIDEYLRNFSPNIFGIFTTNDQKYQEHNIKMIARLNQFRLNEELALHRGQTIPKNQEFLIYNMMRHSLNQIITPSVLAFPYNQEYFNDQTMFPLFLDGGESGLTLDLDWPQSVINKYNKYKHFQNNNFPQEIRQLALTAILNGSDNPTLDTLLLQPPPASMVPPPPPTPPQIPYAHYPPPLPYAQPPPSDPMEIE